ncbi:GNAT family N-acetyltransferase [Kordiimonas aestuarii]|uniref:GNAT family N-acetyltransferase n=1 Tax=Kordiimonas aestuarii TaxID=1005925 RepID=UPI0021D3C8B3|nr:GNAT family N-acetyltransferase [Kordiimonas aestuarii]
MPSADRNPLTEYHISKGPIEPDVWRALPESMPLPLQQHWAYGRALEAIGVPVEMWQTAMDDKPTAFCLAAKRSLAGVIKITSIMRGPLWLAPDTSLKDKAALLAALKAQANPWRWRFLMQQPEIERSEDALQQLKRAKLKRIITGYSTPWLDLRPTVSDLRASLIGKWRNQLSRAEDAHLTISIGGRKDHQYSWLIEKEAEQRKGRGYHGVPLGLVPLFARALGDTGAQAALSVTALSGKRKIAGALFLLHGNSATYHIGWAGEEARAVHAQNRVLFEGMLALRDRGISFLDLGGINTSDGAGIARFKLGTGAKPVTLIGTYI